MYFRSVFGLSVQHDFFVNIDTLNSVVYGRIFRKRWYIELIRSQRSSITGSAVVSFCIAIYNNRSDPRLLTSIERHRIQLSSIDSGHQYFAST